MCLNILYILYFHLVRILSLTTFTSGACKRVALRCTGFNDQSVDDKAGYIGPNISECLVQQSPPQQFEMMNLAATNYPTMPSAADIAGVQQLDQSQSQLMSTQPQLYQTVIS
uniref:FZ domain-containing protein n=1 Tax=Syphacia muris TaxID=451379 RepID=A0A0N5ALG1_9BILA